MKTLLCLLTFLLCWSSSITVSATNWIQLFSFGQGDRVAIDADTLEYDGYLGCMHFWEKTDYLTTESTHLREVYFNLNDSTYAVSELIVLSPYAEPYIQRWGELSFVEIFPASPEDSTRLAVQYINSLNDRNVHWTYNQEPIPEPSPLGSSAWEFDPPNYSIDRETAYSDEWKETYWGLEGTELEYVYLDKRTKKRAVLAYYHVEDGQPMYGYTFPIIIWSQPGGTMTQVEQDCLQDQRALMHTLQAHNAAFLADAEEARG